MAKRMSQEENEVNPDTSLRDSKWDSSVDALCSCCAMVKKRKPAARRTPSTILQKIAGVALDIKEAARTALQNTEACIEIGKRVSTVSALLSKLENTEMVEKQEIRDALNELLEIFGHAHTLVMACQKSGVVTMLFCSPPCKLSKQLSAVLDQLVPNINALIAVIVNSCNVRPRRYKRTRNAPAAPRAPTYIQPERQTSRGVAAPLPKFAEWDTIQEG